MDPKEDLKHLIWFILAIAFVWFLSGGPRNPDDKDKPYIAPPSSTNPSRETYSGDSGSISMLQGALSVSRATSRFALITANANNEGPVIVSGLRLVGTPSVFDIEIPEGYRSAENAQKEPVLLHPGEILLVAFAPDEGPKRQSGVSWIAYLGTPQTTIPSSGGILLLDNRGIVISSATY